MCRRIASSVHLLYSALVKAREGVNLAVLLIYSPTPRKFFCPYIITNICLMLIYGQPSFTRCVSFEAGATISYLLYRHTILNFYIFENNHPCTLNLQMWFVLLWVRVLAKPSSYHAYMNKISNARVYRCD